jgi:regulator of sigma D
MPSRIDELAEQIVSLDSSEQEMLLDLVAELNFQRGLKALSDRYQARLAREDKLEQRADEVLAELRRIREDIAASDHQN